ncbi:MAG: 1,4-alpha-glucan branching protein GlgB [Chitinophagales bacterium]|nr:1,4-alpha-glucan branching protein GlgB [Chitinophagales bacterium]MDW8394158.1 1,4-alpha-glucan branching protein GlgB [Chitinophagales bacterium]
MKKSRKKTAADAHAVLPHSFFSDLDVHLFREGNHYRLYEKFGAHVCDKDGLPGTYFAVWAPNAEYVSVVGNFNGWNRRAHPLKVRWDESGIWEGWIPYVGKGDLYRFFIQSKLFNAEMEKCDPFGFMHTQPPHPASRIHDTWYEWRDEKWMKFRKTRNALTAPFSIYELHLGSWRRSPDDPDKVLSYRQIAEALVPYVQYMGFTHVELLPVMEHPFYGSWGYQITGYFAPTSRMGYPQDLMFLVDELHRNDIGVLLDWVPSHFPDDAHGLIRFDGTALYEHEDRRKGYHPDWNSYIFNYGRNEVRSFLISSACFWLDRYHADGLRVDAVASMLYLDYSRQPGEWIPNEQGGRENLEAIAFLRQLNTEVYRSFPDVQTIAEESTAFPKVSHPVEHDGLGFGMKWMMGWMHDTLQYFAKDPVYRKYHHNLITFSIMYAFSENFVLPFSHDEVVHLKRSMLGKMPGDRWQQFANLRCLYGYMYAHPGAKMLFMGAEFGQQHEWNHEKSLDWHEAADPANKGLENWVHDLNHVLRTEPALYQKNFSSEGFQWLVVDDAEQSVIAFLRRGNLKRDLIVFAANFTPVPRPNYVIGVPVRGRYRELLNSDDVRYDGTGHHLNGERKAELHAQGSFPYRITVNLPPLGVVFLKWQAPRRSRLPRRVSGKTAN